MLSRTLEKTLHRAFALANERRHEYATLEHLLLALSEDEDAGQVLRAARVDLEKLRRDLTGYVDTELANLVKEEGQDAKPTASFQRVLQRAAIHVQSALSGQVTGANVLVAMFAERESRAVYFLQEQNMTRFDAVNFVSHGQSKEQGAAALAAEAAAAANAARWAAAESYPDPAIEILAPAFARIRVFNAAVERLATGYRWCEGPVWFGDGRYLVWSDIPNDRMLRWDEETGAVAPFRKPSNFANGNTRDRQGRLVTCEHGGRRVTRTEYDGSITVLCDRFEGKRLNSPNDVVVKSDGSIWFTDPPFGILSDYEGHKAEPELHPNVYRIDGKSGAVTLMADDMNGPNGLCFTPDETRLWVVDSRARPNPLIRIYDVVENGTKLANGRVFYDGGAGTSPDGFRADSEGNLWAGWGTGEGKNGVLVLSPAGEPIGRIALPERCANLCFGAAKRNRLFMAASQSLYAVYVNAQGVPYF
jgi:gluconolactonase